MKIYKRLFIVLVVSLFVVSVGSVAFCQDGGKININTATVEELAALKRIGPKYAQRIVDYRKANGLFAKAEDIMKVRGIGPKTYNANKNIITVK